MNSKKKSKGYLKSEINEDEEDSYTIENVDENIYYIDSFYGTKKRMKNYLR